MPGELARSPARPLARSPARPLARSPARPLARSPAAARRRAHPRAHDAHPPRPNPAPIPTHSRPVALALAPSPLHCTAQASHALGFVRHGRSGSFLAVHQRPPLPERLAGVVPPLQPGDVLLFTDLTLHRSGPNTTPLARWSADWAYELQASDAICPAIGPPAPPAEEATAPAEVASPASPDAAVPASAGLGQKECACRDPANSSAAASPAPAAAPAPELSLVEARWLRLGLAAGGLLILIAVSGSWVGQRRKS